ncbi:histidinol-phosphate aminotransferase [Catalinimonas alkaloidigena]|uniref:Histidinol-phosphate aminotransferase n=1 Tax=Catalinimonas alkaloidigena TaxID=1075417 RepID=A0A1G9FEP3_9BACT|nr:histidinol-phosphate transaminase [Catalinimonas alkaloidigena]SDK86830.1 histidinol-phosphate aminotransferase [Catalinimonas alkaloidigena]
MKPLEDLIRPHLRDLVPYSSARDEYTGKEGVFLDANENAFGSALNDALNRYPDPYQQQLKQALAAIKGVRPDQIFLGGGGSDEAIDLLIRMFCRPGKDNILILPPTYGMYEVSAAVNDVSVVRAPLTADFQIDVERTLAAVDEHTKLLFVCSPNNPTGNLMAAASVRTLLESFSGMVIVDEAYIDFAPDQTWLAELRRYPNLVVLQTFSKAWGLAALRLGMAFASPDVIQVLNKIKLPYNVNELTQRAGLEALLHEREKDQMVDQILQQRRRLTQQLQELPYVEHIYPSDANFLLVKMQDAGGVFRYLIEQLVIVRDRSRLRQCEGCLRITVGTEEENETLLRALHQFSPVV